MGVPQTIHHIWIGPDPLPAEHRPWIDSWKRHHPDWEFRLWSEENLPSDPIRPEVLQRLRAPVERADILRLEVLYRYGGVYLDTDVECLRPIDDELAGQDFVGVCLKPGQVTNTVIAAAAKHRILNRALRELRPMEEYWTLSSPREAIKEVAGPPFLAQVIARYRDVRLLEPPVFFPSTPKERKRALGVHHMARTWHNVSAMRTAMLQAERRLEATKAELEREKQLHAATSKRLAALEEREAKRDIGKERVRDRLGLPRRPR